MGLKNFTAKELFSATQKYYKENPRTDKSSFEGKIKACFTIYTDLTGGVITDYNDAVGLLNIFGTEVRGNQTQILQEHLLNVEATGATWMDCMPFLW